jgi:cytochrome c oxidase subunit II
LDPAGPFAQQIAEVFWFFLAVAVFVYVAVIGFLVYSLRRGRNTEPAAGTHFDPRPAVRAIGIALGVTGVILVVLACTDFLGGRLLAAAPSDAMRIRITAHQWWWEIEYLDANPSRRLVTANELCIPAGKPVVLELGSNDVIHSFWVPSLQGKKDLLPGYRTQLPLLASRPGHYTGECAEFCGFQHAHMSIDVEAKATTDFASWMNAQLADAPEPSSDELRRGRDVFLRSSCKMCHAIQGTDAAARLGPDLTHVASRRRIAAGTLPNNAASLAAWISDPQSIKPGSRMPATSLPADDLSALTAYLGSLR